MGCGTCDRTIKVKNNFTFKLNITILLYFCIFEGADKTEFERFLEKFSEESTLNKLEESTFNL